MLLQMLSPQDYLDIIAQQKAWDVFFPVDDPDEECPSTETKGRWLRGTLYEWGWIANRLADRKEAWQLRDFEADHSRDTALQRLLESLIHAEEVLLAFRKHNVLLDIPGEFVEGADKLLDAADRLGISTRRMPLRQIARRLSAAVSHTAKEPRELTVRGDHLYFSATGRKVLDVDAKRVVEGLNQVQGGGAHPLDQIQRAERPNGL